MQILFILEYSYIVNVHQAKNVLSDVLGNATSSFDHDGEVKDGQSISTVLPSFDIGYIKQIANKASEEANVGGNMMHYSASIDLVTGQQDYNLQKIIYNQSLSSGSAFHGLVEGKR